MKEKEEIAFLNVAEVRCDLRIEEAGKVNKENFRKFSSFTKKPRQIHDKTRRNAHKLVILLASPKGYITLLDTF